MWILEVDFSNNSPHQLQFYTKLYVYAFQNAKTDNYKKICAKNYGSKRLGQNLDSDENSDGVYTGVLTEASSCTQSSHLKPDFCKSKETNLIPKRVLSNH